MRLSQHIKAGGLSVLLRHGFAAVWLKTVGRPDLAVNAVSLAYLLHLPYLLLISGFKPIFLSGDDRRTLRPPVGWSRKAPKPWAAGSHPNVDHQHMVVSCNGGTPKSSIFMGFSPMTHPFWGTPIYGKPHVLKYCVCFLMCMVLLYKVLRHTCLHSN